MRLQVVEDNSLSCGVWDLEAEELEFFKLQSWDLEAEELEFFKLRRWDL
jgi:hypothetical protein